MKECGENGRGSPGGAPRGREQRSGIINPKLGRGQSWRLEIVRAMAIVLTRGGYEGSARAAPMVKGV